MKLATVLLLFLSLAPSIHAQIVPVGPFTGDVTESFETQPAQNGVLCLASRIFGDRADLCARSGPVLYVGGGFSGSGTIFSHGGMRSSFSGQGGAVLSFDSPVQSFGGWFGTISSSNGGTARFYDASGNTSARDPSARRRA